MAAAVMRRGLLRPNHYWKFSPIFGTVRHQRTSYVDGMVHRSCSSGPLSGPTVRIGCASGFWGDTSVAAPQLVKKGRLDFLVFDYLAEVTMSLLSAAKLKFPELGYAPDFVQVAIAPLLKDIKQKGVRVISNAGGVNPLGCAAALQHVAKKAGIELNVAVVTGDDLISMKSELEKMGIKDMDTGLGCPGNITSMSAYLGAGSIRRALDRGADIVVTGRCVDTALVLAPLLHSFKWEADNFDMLASGSVAGHLIECGAQVTGGIFTDWHTVPDWPNIGFPIVEVAKDGRFVVTKPPGTGGLVSKATVAEQLVYEIGDPRSYVLPDVVCDVSQVHLKDLGDDQVLVSGARGRPPTDSYKVCATYAEGYRLTAVCTLAGIRAVDKGRRTAQSILQRTRGMFKALGMEDYSKVNLQILGAEDTYGPHAQQGQGPREAVVWLAVHHRDKKALQVLSREIAPAGTGMAPGLCGIVGGRPKVSPVLKLFSFLLPKDKIKIQIHQNGETEDFVPPHVDTQPLDSTDQQEADGSSSDQQLASGTHSYRLEELAYARSGDKGNNCNIGVVARHPSYLPYVRQALTAKAVDDYMSHVFEDHSGPVQSRVTRYEWPGVHGLNFVLHNSLGGGGIASLRSDPQGKAFAQMLLDFRVENVPELTKAWLEE